MAAEDDIIALIRGESGPFMETESSFFGRKRVDPSMKDAKMETDCGGMIITKGNMTYGEADKLASTVDITAIRKYISHDRSFPSCYWHPKNGKIYTGEMWWAIYSYLAYNKIIEGKWNSYNNALEYLYDEILRRMEKSGLIKSIDRLYFTLGQSHD